MSWDFGFYLAVTWGFIWEVTPGHESQCRSDVLVGGVVCGHQRGDVAQYLPVSVVDSARAVCMNVFHSQLLGRILRRYLRSPGGVPPDHVSTVFRDVGHHVPGYTVHGIWRGGVQPTPVDRSHNADCDSLTHKQGDHSAYYGDKVHGKGGKGGQINGKKRSRK